MEAPSYKKTYWLFVVSYLIVLGLALFFSKGISEVHSARYLVLALAGMGLVVGVLFIFLSKKRERGSSAISFLIFQLVQGGLGFLISFYIFDLPLKENFAYPSGAGIAFIAWWSLSPRRSSSLSGMILAGFLALGLVIALRLGGVFSSLVFGLALLNSFWLGTVLLSSEESTRELWLRSIFYISLLVVGRAVIQYYLLKSNYASLGVVITHSYTYAALFAGFALPAVFGILQRDRVLHPILGLVILGIGLPLVLGTFFHVRPMAGFLLGLVSSSFLFGLLFFSQYTVGLLSYLSLAAVALGLPLFKSLNNLSRVLRLEILGALLVAALLGYFLLRLKAPKASPET